MAIWGIPAGRNKNRVTDSQRSIGRSSSPSPSHLDACYREGKVAVLVEVHHPEAHQRLEAWPMKGALLGALFQVGEPEGNQEAACLQTAHRKTRV